MPHVLVLDIETVPELAGFAAANGHQGKTEDEIAPNSGINFQSTSITQSSTSAR